MTIFSPRCCHHARVRILLSTMVSYALWSMTSAASTAELPKTELMKEASPVAPGFVSVSATPAAGGGATHGGKATQDPYPTLGPLLSQRAAAYAAGAASGTSGGAGPAELVRLTIYVDTKGRLAGLSDFLSRHGGQPGRPLVGAAGDVFGGALPASVPVSVLADLAVQPGVRYVRERIPPRLDRPGPTSRFPNGAKAAQGRGGVSSRNDTRVAFRTEARTG